MAFPNPFKKEPSSSSAPRVEPRVEPRLGAGDAQDDSPWVSHDEPTVNPGASLHSERNDGPRLGAVPTIETESTETFSLRKEEPLTVPTQTEAVDDTPEPTPKTTLASLWAKLTHKDKRTPAEEPVTETVTPEVGERVTRTPSDAPKSVEHMGAPGTYGIVGSDVPPPSPTPIQTKRAKPIPSDQELLARQKTRNRLVGAAALLMAAVIIAPLFLDSEKAIDEAKVSTTIPPVTDAQRVEVPLEKPAETTTTVGAPTTSDPAPVLTGSAAVNSDTGALPLATPPATSTTQPATNVAPAPTPAPSAPEKVKEEPKKVADTPKPEKVAKTPEKPEKTEATATGKGFYVQVVAVSGESRANAVLKKLHDNGLPAYKMKVDGKNIWRIRVGLFKTRQEAQSAIGKLVLLGYHDKLSPEMQ